MFLAPPLISKKATAIKFIQQKNPINLVIDCRATGYPRPVYSWTKDGQKLSNDRIVPNGNGSLVVKEARKSDGGRYSCIASNDLGKDKKSFTVTVFGRFCCQFSRPCGLNIT